MGRGKRRSVETEKRRSVLVTVRSRLGLQRQGVAWSPLSKAGMVTLCTGS